jgi:hypothetical protein
MKRTGIRKVDAEWSALPRLPRAAYQLKITLREIDPPVWRRVVVSGDLRLGKLHRIIQTVMGWEDSHLHRFEVGRNRYAPPELEDPEAKDESSVRLQDVAPKVGASFDYLYDMGDSWRHEIFVEKIERSPKGQKLPLCLDGARACPPEDVGGIGGYEDLVKAMKGPDSDERKEFVQWLGREYDSEAFSVNQVNEILGMRRG